MGTVKDVFDIIKELFKEAKELNDKTVANEFCSKLLEIQETLLDVRFENQGLCNKIEELKKDVLPNNIRWSSGGIGMYKDSIGENYICRFCYEEYHKIYHAKARGDVEFECPKCKQRYFYFINK